MDKQTYSHPIISKYINENFYAVKFNAEGNQTVNFYDRVLPILILLPRQKAKCNAPVREVYECQWISSSGIFRRKCSTHYQFDGIFLCQRIRTLYHLFFLKANIKISKPVNNGKTIRKNLNQRLKSNSKI